MEPDQIINPATRYIDFSRSLPAARHQNAAVAPPTASFDNADCRQARFGLSFQFNLLGTSSRPDSIGAGGVYASHLDFTVNVNKSLAVSVKLV